MPIGAKIIEGITSFVGGKSADLVKNITGLVDESKFSAEEKAAHELKVADMLNKYQLDLLATTNKHFEAELADMADARNREIEIVTSDKAPLLNKIIQPILAILILGSCFLFWYIMLFRAIPKEKEIMIAGITGSLTTLAMGVVGYYFGSSSGSKTKSDQLDKMMNK